MRTVVINSEPLYRKVRYIGKSIVRYVVDRHGEEVLVIMDKPNECFDKYEWLNLEKYEDALEEAKAISPKVSITDKEESYKVIAKILDNQYENNDWFENKELLEVFKIESLEKAYQYSKYYKG
jgi:hypothetical protein